MEKGWYWKVFFVVLLTIGAALYVAPTFMGDSLPDWYTGFFNKKVNLGLDLQGGSHLVLGVDVDKALEDKADQMARDFQELLREKRIGYTKIYRVPGTSDIQFELNEAGDVPRFEKRVLEGYYNLKMIEPEDKRPGLVRLAFEEKYVNELKRNARDTARSTVENRVNEFRVAEPIIAFHGDTGILVQLPGMFDPERAKSLLGRTAQLEFRLVDDGSSFFKDFKDTLPADIRLDFYTYEGPNDEPVTTAMLIAKGKGTEGRERILDFLNGVDAIQKFLLDRSVDAKVVEQVVAIARGGMSPAERAEIMQLVRPLLASAAPAEPAPAAAAPAPAAAEPGAPAATPAPAAAEPGAPAAAPAPAAPASTDLARFEKLLDGRLPADRVVGFERSERQLEVEYKTYLLHADVAMTGDYITDAVVRPDPDSGQPEVGLDFDRTGAVLFEKLTGANVKKRMAIVLEGDVSSAPVIQTRIAGGKARITLGSGQGYDQALTEAQDLAMVLRAGALPAPVRILEERTVGPSMGEDARNQGAMAMLIGLVLVVLFMVIYYGVAGVFADLALCMNALFMLAIMAGLGATLTLPGMAGIVLTMGMAVDANVIINERIREELAAGKTPRAAVEAGYSRAFWTIFDANFTTIISTVVLWSYGSGPIQGFAVTLFIGVIVSMFTAIVVTRLFMDYSTIKRKVQRLSV